MFLIISGELHTLSSNLNKTDTFDILRLFLKQVSEIIASQLVAVPSIMLEVGVSMCLTVWHVSPVPKGPRYQLVENGPTNLHYPCAV